MRIYPLFWASLAGTLLVPALPGADNSLRTLFAQPWSLLLIGAPAAHPVAWTLTYEVQFYAVASIMVLFGPYARRAFLGWVVVNGGLVVLSNFGWIPRIPLTDALSLEFCLGILVGVFGSRVHSPAPWKLIGAAFAVVVVASIIIGDRLPVTAPIRALFWGVPAALIIWSALTLEQNGLRSPKWFTFLGNISYSIYMWHPVVFAVAASILTSFGLLSGTAGEITFLVGSLIGIVAIGAVSYFSFEKPVLKSFGKVEAQELPSPACSPAPEAIQPG